MSNTISPRMPDHSAAELQQRWRGEEQRIALVLAAWQDGTEWRQFLGTFTHQGQRFEKLAYVETYPVSRLPFPDLRGLSLEHCSFSGIDLSGAWLHNTKLFQVNFDSCRLSSMSTPTNLRHAVLVHCTCRQTDFTGADCRESHFGHCDFSQSTFAHAHLDGATLRSSKLNRANFDSTALREVNFFYSDLKEIIVSSATDIGIAAADDKLGASRLRLHREAETLTFDRFQFASPHEAFDHAAGIYRAFRIAYNAHGALRLAERCRVLEAECRRLAIQSGSTPESAK